MSRQHRHFSAILLVCVLLLGCGRAPSIGPDREAFTTIDALFTAMSLKDQAQLDRNAATIEKLHESGRLPDAAHDALAAMIAEARAGQWEPATKHLRAFMLDQRP
jgi:hypothetical protein